ncbi:FG-GAP-like repeat-containing protein [Streptomyces sp. VRA16 Mangrove soil]|uniref:FG-GAP-like repeat-containing protein n=1 Tax=Streptomyces sp. VRA16 Mangrove soil TaxID=2817434 RepID=UPI001A9F2DD5|nr:FG-GAP-like repeat-containing protein [Streptomyces sp. VRA16 Mangrove soil]MBO1333635.1 FG-GAP repeat protein [Streptomyces sp. VRA16 Mangrove soil]
MRKNRTAALAAASFLLLTGAFIATAPAAYAGVPGGTRASDRNTDFNGDGYDDVLVGAPGATVGGHAGAGVVTVQYGGPSGMGTSRSAVFSQNTTGVPGGAEAGDAFGQAVATGDLDGDGYDDAIIGSPGEDLGTAADSGGGVVLWGTPNGLVGTESTGIQADAPVSGGKFGLALAAARFTDVSDGDMLAVLDSTGLSLYAFDAASPALRTGTAPSGKHLRLDSRTDFRSKAPKARGLAADEAPGIQPMSLTTGDYDANGFADLVVSGTSVEQDTGSGWSYVLPGSASDADPLPPLAVRGGPVVASGDVNGDGKDDLVTGEPHSPHDSGATMTGGEVAVHFGSDAGPSGDPQVWTQDSDGVPGTAEQGDGWGGDLSVGDTNGDGFADVAVGAPGEDIGSVADAGAVWVLRGSAGGLTATGVRDFNQDSADVPGTAEKGDKFGAQVSFTDPNDDGRFGLLAAAPGENTNDGVVWVFSAGSGGVTASGSWTYGAGSLGAPSLDARFGAAVDD